jgi:hypothetical protein
MPRASRVALTDARVESRDQSRNRNTLIRISAFPLVERRVLPSRGISLPRVDWIARSRGGEIIRSPGVFPRVFCGEFNESEDRFEGAKRGSACARKTENPACSFAHLALFNAPGPRLLSTCPALNSSGEFFHPLRATAGEPGGPVLVCLPGINLLRWQERSR